MTYNEWRDELKNNLLCVSEAERRRVLDYYAEAYADRRDAGFSEREIINEFGAPYDAAQKILYENSEGTQNRTFGSGDSSKQAPPDPFSQYGSNYGGNYGNFSQNRQNPFSKYGANGNNTPPPPPPSYNYNAQGTGTVPPSNGEQNANTNAHTRQDNSWVLIVLCVVFATPLFGFFVGLIGLTVGLTVAPFGLLISGVITIGAGIGTMFVDGLSGAAVLGVGLMLFGGGLILIPLGTKFVKIIWQATRSVFGWIKSLFSGRGNAV